MSGESKRNQDRKDRLKKADILPHASSGPLEIPDRRAAKLHRFSPFGFETLGEFPRPTPSLLFTAFFFFLMACGYVKYFDNSSAISDELAEFIHVERSAEPYEPEIFIVGSSYAGMGTYADLLSKRLGKKVSKVSLGYGIFWESAQIVRKYGRELDNVKVIIVELNPGSFQRIEGKLHYKNRFDFLIAKHDLKEYAAPAHPCGYCTKKTLLPMRFSLSQIRNVLRTKFKRTGGRETYWKTLHRVQKSIDYRKNFPGKREIFHQSVREGGNDRREDIRFDETLAGQPFEFLDYCKKKNIFVVFNVYPREIGRSVPLPSENLPPGYERYWQTLRELDEKPNCAVITAGCFHDIIPDIEKHYEQTGNEPLTFDNRHMTREGATIYTEWLADRMCENSKIVAALGIHRNPREFFVRRNAAGVLPTEENDFAPTPFGKEAIKVASPFPSAPKQ